MKERRQKKALHCIIFVIVYLFKANEHKGQDLLSLQVYLYICHWFCLYAAKINTSLCTLRRRMLCWINCYETEHEYEKKRKKMFSRNTSDLKKRKEETVLADNFMIRWLNLAEVALHKRIHNFFIILYVFFSTLIFVSIHKAFVQNREGEREEKKEKQYQQLCLYGIFKKLLQRFVYLPLRGARVNLTVNNW